MSKQTTADKGVTVTILPKGYIPTQDEHNRTADIIMGEDSVDRRLTEEGKAKCMIVDNGDGTCSVQIGAFTGSTPKVLVGGDRRVYVREDEPQFRLDNVRLPEAAVAGMTATGLQPEYAHRRAQLVRMGVFAPPTQGEEVGKLLKKD